MYQPLIWPTVLGYDARSLGATSHTQCVERLANALIHGVRRNVELSRNFLRGEMLIDKAKAIELAGAQARDPRYHIVVRRAVGPVSRVRHARHLLQRKSHPPTWRYSLQRVQRLTYSILDGLAKFFAVFREIVSVRSKRAINGTGFPLLHRRDSPVSLTLLSSSPKPRKSHFGTAAKPSSCRTT
jgi:hypothetical protein